MQAASAPDPRVHVLTRSSRQPRVMLLLHSAGFFTYSSIAFVLLSVHSPLHK
jgi:hypothetical protein